MKKVIFITSSKINYLLPNLTLYESIRQTAAGNMFPHLEKKIFGKPKVIFDQIMSASSNQCLETAKVFGQPIKVIEELLPLKFELEKVISQKEFEGLGNKAFDVLRKRYLKLFFENKLKEDNREVINRFNKIVKLIPDKTTTLAVSHAYLIKQLEAYSKLGEEMFLDFEKLKTVFKPEQETMGRLETVEIIIN